MVTVVRRPGDGSMCTIFASSSLSITGNESETWRACSGPAVRRLRSGPREGPREGTTPSRIQSSGRVRLDLVVLDEPAGLGVDEEHAAGLQSALAHDAALLDVEHADLAREHDEAVVGHDVSARTEAVAVECGADERAVGEDDRGGGVPPLPEERVGLVERPGPG